MCALVFLHLSDIHFRRNAGKTYDPFADLRNELELDLAAFSKEHFKSFSAILVTGDIAYSGAIEEYGFASAWLEKVANELSLSPGEDVRVIPGNHDIQRDVVNGSPTIQGYHSALRTPDADLNELLIGYLEKDTEARRIIYKPLQNYVDFAARFQCEVSATKPFWDSPYRLNDGSLLIVRGMNSTLISDELDTDAAHKLVVGNHQLELTRQDGVEYMALCHHPPQWLLDQDQAETLLTDRARIQLFGHKHQQRLTRLEDSVRIVAGAVHSEKREPTWAPRYNFLKIETSEGDNLRKMHVTVYPRVFDGTHFVSGADAHISKQYDLPLKPWAGRPGTTREQEARDATVTLTSTEGGLHMRPGRRLTYRFLSLPYHARIKVVQQLNLVHADDEGLRDSELYQRYFSRAAEREQLHDLWNLINEYSDECEDNRGC